MGVTYKLKEEIIDFIKHHKHLNPRISCRNLVGLIEEKFQIKVSKSSINAVIKEAQLSSPIGRPSGAVSPRKFAIPPEKRIQPTNTDLTKIDRSSENPAQHKVNKEKVVAHVSDTKRIIKLNTDGLTNKRRKEELHSRNIKDSPISTEEKVVKIAVKRVLMLIILRDYFSGPVLDEFFKRNTSFSQREIDILDVLLCFYPEIFSQPGVALDGENLAIWEMHGWKQVPDLNEIKLIIEYLKSTPIQVFDFYLEADYFFSEVHSMNFFLEDGGILRIDGRMKSILDTNVDGLICPIEKSLANLSDFLSGVNPINLTCPGRIFRYDVFQKLFDICNNPHKLKKVALYSGDGMTLLEMDIYNIGRRKFILNVNDFGDGILGKERDCLSEKVSIYNQSFQYDDSTWSAKDLFPQSSNDMDIRLISFYEQGSDTLRHCLTNIELEESPTAKILAKFTISLQAHDRLVGCAQSGIFSALKGNSLHENLTILLSDVLQKMQRLFCLHNIQAVCNNDEFVCESEEDIRLVYSRINDEILLSLVDNLGMGDNKASAILSCLFSIGFNRIKLPQYS